MDIENLNIRDCDEAYLMEHADEFSDLCVRAFAEHAEKGVKMGPCYMTPEKWKKWAVGCIGQCITEENKIIAIWLARPNYKKKTADGRLLAIDPEYKGRHLGLSLSQSFSRKLRDMGMNVFHTDTSLKAPHVVKFHKSYGCKAVGMGSWSNTNYYSVLLRLALRPEHEISDEEAERRFKRSARLCKLRFNEDGSLKLLGKLEYAVLYIPRMVRKAIKATKK